MLPSVAVYHFHTNFQGIRMQLDNDHTKIHPFCCADDCPESISGFPKDFVRVKLNNYFQQSSRGLFSYHRSTKKFFACASKDFCMYFKLKKEPSSVFTYDSIAVSNKTFVRCASKNFLENMSGSMFQIASFVETLMVKAKNWFIIHSIIRPL